ncbi:MAG TPA: PTS sugar transporter subunit IIC [Gemmatimonadales bacterium]|jgi:PTS system mannose-specific IIC component|nr:PTS sugar transporter subunit IIC [Gemmatimonadales bacterium]
MTVATLLLLLAVGTAAGLDLVSGPQVLLARPFVAGTLSGLVLGDPLTGIVVGATLELYALEVLPVGATRYPDHGPGTVGAVWLGSTLSGAGALGVAVFAALVTAGIGTRSLLLLRRANGAAITRAEGALAAGTPGVLARLQVGGALRDLARSLAMTVVGLGVAALCRRFLPTQGPEAWRLSAVAIGAGAAGALVGAIRTAGRGPRLAVLTGGVAAGCVWTWLRATGGL